jgi:hypothetical protein
LFSMWIAVMMDEAGCSLKELEKLMSITCPTGNMVGLVLCQRTGPGPPGPGAASCSLEGTTWGY